MIGETKYKYIDSNAPNVKINYSYSKYLGLQFIDYWKISRKENLKEFSKENLDVLIKKEDFRLALEGFTSSKEMFSKWLKNIDLLNLDFIKDVNLLVKRFEVIRKIYNEYNDLMRPNNKNDYLQIDNYSLFGIVLGLLFSETKKYQYLNAHVKLNDILLGWKTYNLNEDSLTIRAYSLDLEYKNVLQILSEKDIPND
tara:strand:- start:161 stop:751 length:591 start_codon:yes stop_codon:yes gene_type:complete